jgi:hypothetical protein
VSHQKRLRLDLHPSWLFFEAVDFERPSTPAPRRRHPALASMLHDHPDSVSTDRPHYNFDLLHDPSTVHAARRINIAPLSRVLTFTLLLLLLLLIDG